MLQYGSIKGVSRSAGVSSYAAGFSRQRKLILVRRGHARDPHEGVHYGEIAMSTGGFFFVWTLWALGGLGGFTFILSVRGLWSLRRGQPQESNNPNVERPVPRSK